MHKMLMHAYVRVCARACAHANAQRLIIKDRRLVILSHPKDWGQSKMFEATSQTMPD